jgi:DNA polymerase-3 subunit alpha/error-prone DNA polymerase
LLSKLTEDDTCSKTETLIPEDQLLEKYADYPEIIKNTELVLDQCHFEFEFKTLEIKILHQK